MVVYIVRGVKVLLMCKLIRLVPLLYSVDIDMHLLVSGTPTLSLA